MASEQPQIEIASEKKNPLLRRTELKLQVRHSGGATPNRQVLRVEIGRLSKTKPESVYIQKIVTDYGAGISECVASVYEMPEFGEAVESEYIRKRNAGLETKEKPEQPKQVAAPGATAAPAQAPGIPVPTPPQSESESRTPKMEAAPTGTKAEPTVTQPSPAEVPKPKAARKKPAKEKEPDESKLPEPKPRETAPASEKEESSQ